MATTPLSRNAFADPAIPTFADLIARVKADPTIPKRRRQNWVWALKALPRSVGKDPAAIPAHPEFLRAIFKRAAPASVGLKQAAWNNVRSLIADSDGSRPLFRDDLARHSDLISLGIPR